MQFPGANGQSTSQTDVIDTHCHLTDAAFTEDVEEVVKRAQAGGITGAILVTESCGDFKRALELHSRFPKWINLCMGVHPVQEDEEGRCVKLEHWLQAQDLILANREKLVGIGEVGLDFTPRYCSRPDSHETQRAVLLEQARLAKQLDLPLNVHSRSAGKPVIELLKGEGVTRVQMHAFNGRLSAAMEGVSAGFYFSVPPCVLHSEQKQKLVKELPLDRLLTETDSPVLGVDKTVRNEPAECNVVCSYIAKVKNMEVDVVKQILAENARKLYPNLVTTPSPS
ncbi:Putative deoxyribonuclease tatdn3 [Sparganum proliferum]